MINNRRPIFAFVVCILGLLFIAGCGTEEVPSTTTASSTTTTTSLPQFTVQTVDSAGVTGKYTSIALDDNGKVFISYYGGELKNATNISGSWETAIVDSVGDVGMYTSTAARVPARSISVITTEATGI